LFSFQLLSQIEVTEDGDVVEPVLPNKKEDRKVPVHRKLEKGARPEVDILETIVEEVKI
jgi:hypothetical protein